MKLRWPVLLVLLLSAALIVTACGDDDDDDDADDTPTATATETEATPTEVAPTELTASVSGDSGVTGTVTLTPDPESTKITVSLDGLPDGPHANHIHHGSCAEQGEVHVPLTQLEPTDGAATGEAIAPDLTLDHFATGHYYAVHTGGDDSPGEVIACGDVVAG